MGGTQAQRRSARYSALLIVNSAGEVKSTFVDAHRSHEAARYLCEDETRLLPEIEAVFLRMKDSLERSDGSGTLLVVGERAMRLSPLKSRNENLFALVIETDRYEHPLTRAASRYGLTRRQIEVLLLVLEGANAGEVARALNIAEYTAQGHVKALLVKTGSRNRAAMAAKVLDWSVAQPAEAAPPASRSINGDVLVDAKSV